MLACETCLLDRSQLTEEVILGEANLESINPKSCGFLLIGHGLPSCSVKFTREVVDLILSKIERSIQRRLVDGSAVAWQIASDGYKVLWHNWSLL